MLNAGAYLYVIYADDYREELDGRSSIIGWHHQKSCLHFPKSQPLLVKRLAVHGTLCLPEEEEVLSLKIGIYLGSDLITLQDLTDQAKAAVDPEPHYKGRRLNPPMFTFDFTLENLHLPKPTLIFPSAFINGIEVKGNRFLVTNE